jgi:hypothetical protein
MLKKMKAKLIWFLVIAAIQAPHVWQCLQKEAAERANPLNHRQRIHQSPVGHTSRIPTPQRIHQTPVGF